MIPAIGPNPQDSEDAPRHGSLQTLRSERTRLALLAAAEKIFARDGFEASRIEDIAAEAGRSRGAFYANFQNKTEVFLALRTRAMQRRAREVRGLFLATDDPIERERTIYQHILRELCDSQSLLLQIEFKLFALRHPEMLAELSEKHLEASTSIHIEEFRGVKDMPTEELRRNTLAIEALLEGFVLNGLFSPQVLTQPQLEQLFPRLLADILAPTH